jgi:release factor glutamine methyltransferase
VTPATLDPRPETETLVEAALALVAEEGLADRPFRFLDIGTGTGCIAVTLLAELRAATALATDVSQAALDVAWKNAIRHGVSSRLEVQRRSFLEGVAGAFALAVSNPPYISSDEIGALDPEVRLHDPWAALDGGVDGLACFGRIIDGVSDVVPNGWVVLEVGAGQARQVVSLVERRLAGRVHPHVRTWRDLGGHSRVVAFKTQH